MELKPKEIALSETMGSHTKIGASIFKMTSRAIDIALKEQAKQIFNEMEGKTTYPDLPGVGIEGSDWRKLKKKWLRS